MSKRHWNKRIEEIKEILRKHITFQDNIKTLDNERCCLITEDKFNKILKELEE